MNDALFIRRGRLDAGRLVILAQNLGMEADAFRSCMKSLETEQDLQDDLKECREVAIECRKMGGRFGTPTFTVHGRVVVGVKPKAYWMGLTDRLRKAHRSDHPPVEGADSGKVGSAEPQK
jgi:predicted DsbA family dithiol-disulfide isomerase